jgi:hypothetical protein
MFPAWLLRFSIWELAGVISYPLVEALLESCIFWLGMLILSFVLPKNWLENKFVALSSILVWVMAAWAVLIQFIYGSILQWEWQQMVPGLLLVVFSFGFIYWLVQRFGRFEGWIKKAAQGLAVLAYFYIFFDLLGLAVLIIRNL